MSVLANERRAWCLVALTLSACGGDAFQSPDGAAGGGGRGGTASSGAAGDESGGHSGRAPQGGGGKGGSGNGTSGEGGSAGVAGGGGASAGSGGTLAAGTGGVGGGSSGATSGGQGGDAGGYWGCDLPGTGCLCSPTEAPDPSRAKSCPPSDCCFLFGTGSPRPCACNTEGSSLDCEGLRDALNGDTAVDHCPP
jgi:hypothetical protein